MTDDRLSQADLDRIIADPLRATPVDAERTALEVVFRRGDPMTPVYVVMGSVGAYSDTSIWYVYAFDTPESAEEYAQRVRDRYDEVLARLRRAGIWFDDTPPWSGATAAERAEALACVKLMAELDPKSVSIEENGFTEGPLGSRGYHADPTWEVLTIQRKESP